MKGKLCEALTMVERERGMDMRDAKGWRRVMSILPNIALLMHRVLDHVADVIEMEDKLYDALRTVERERATGAEEAAEAARFIAKNVIVDID